MPETFLNVSPSFSSSLLSLLPSSSWPHHTLCQPSPPYSLRLRYVSTAHHAHHTLCQYGTSRAQGPLPPSASSNRSIPPFPPLDLALRTPDGDRACITLAQYRTETDRQTDRYRYR
eukprot:1764732-Rhodomonas_salina.1